MAKSKKAEVTRVIFPTIATRSDAYREQMRTHELLEDQILLVNNLFVPSARQLFKRFFETTIAPKLSQPVAPKRGEATRTNERFSQHDEAFAQHLFVASGLADLPEVKALSPGRVVGLNPNIRIYRYQQGAFFGPHYDDHVKETVAGQSCVSEWTLLIYLCENLVGGETRFRLGKGEMLVPPAEDGMALLHRHGRDCLLHEGMPVKQGVKWVLRSDLMFSL